MCQSVSFVCFSVGMLVYLAYFCLFVCFMAYLYFHLLVISGSPVQEWPPQCYPGPVLPPGSEPGRGLHRFIKFLYHWDDTAGTFEGVLSYLKMYCKSFFLQTSENPHEFAIM